MTVTIVFIITKLFNLIGALNMPLTITRKTKLNEKYAGNIYD